MISFLQLMGAGVNDHPHNGWLGFYGAKIQGCEAPQSLKTTRWNRVRSTRFGKPNLGIFTASILRLLNPFNLP
jgi:hypothetical protein